jgi:hypothetical protein
MGSKTIPQRTQNKQGHQELAGRGSPHSVLQLEAISPKPNPELVPPIDPWIPFAGAEQSRKQRADGSVR